MMSRLDEHSKKLNSIGWIVEKADYELSIPEEVRGRYVWLPIDIIEFLEGFSVVATGDEKSWFLTSKEIVGYSETAFAWNQWELDSLEAAGNDSTWASAIRSFWDQHFPILMSVREGYKFLAVRRYDLKIVGGAEPEFEEVVVVANSFKDLLQNIDKGVADAFI